MLPTAKQNENFFGEVIINGNKKKLQHIAVVPIIIKTAKTPIFLSTSIVFIILLATLSLHVSSFSCENEELVSWSELLTVS